jgi:hypothetical protein
MPNPWTQFSKAALAVVSLLALLGLIPHVQSAMVRGWPLGIFPVLAGWLDDTHWYLPAAALVGGVAVAVSSFLRPPRFREVLVAAMILATLSFALRGFVGPHLFHHATHGLLDTTNPQQAEFAATLRPNSWNYLRWLATEEPARSDVGAILAMVHSTVAFAILSAIMLPLGLLIGTGSRRFTGASRRRAAWAMAAGTIAVVYGAQIGAWRVAVTAELWPVALVYLGFLTVPLVILLTLVWSGAGGPGVHEPRGPLAPEAPR